MARNNLTWITGDITGNIYLDPVHLDGKEVQFLRMSLMFKRVTGAAILRGLRLCVYGVTCEYL